ncbi:MAG: hypothetical protein JNM31_03890 [Flavobacteriales bacterium]|nr:hypothetical protein [Flavobacteriales bacterium]
MTAPKSDTKTTMLAITTGFVVLFLIFKLKWMLTVAAVAGLIGLFVPALAALVEKGWLKLAAALGWLNGRILLGLVFFVILTPIALLRKLFGGSKALALQRSTGTHWSVRDHTYAPADLEKPW